MIKDLVPACFILFAGCFMLFVFEPLLAYATNMDDFWFDFKLMIWPVLGMFVCFLLIGFLLLLAAYLINLKFSEKLLVYKGIVLAGFIGFFLLYLQGNWLAGNLPGLTGDEIIWEKYGKFENIILISAFILLCIAVAVGVRKIKLDRVIRYAAMVSSVVFVMLFVSLIPTLATNDAFRAKYSFNVTTENFNTVSSNKNFLIFLVDSVDSRTLYDVMNKDDDFREMFEDFTYYPDMLSAFPYTKDSVPAILTGVINRNETRYVDYCANAFNQSPLFNKLAQNGYTINLYSTLSWEGHQNFTIDNYATVDDNKVDFIRFVKQELKYIAYKYFPYPIKKYSRIDGMDFNLCKISPKFTQYKWGNRNVYKYIQRGEELETQSQNYFQFVHCEGGHTPANMDKDLNKIKNGTYGEKVAASLTLIKAYLQRLKDNNAFDNSAIVILSDHGYGYYDARQNYEQPYFSLACFNSVLLIKGINEKHEFQESARPVSCQDLQEAFSDLIDGKQSGELFADFEPGRVRTIMWQKMWNERDIVEYATTGKAYELEKFVPTGNEYKWQG